MMPILLDRLSQGFSYLLILAATVMLGWGTLGFLEYFTGLAPLVPLQNATFPGGTQFLHWLLITLSGLVLLTGYFLRWRYTPLAMIVLYAAIATLCAIEATEVLETLRQLGQLLETFDAVLDQVLGFVDVVFHAVVEHALHIDEAATDGLLDVVSRLHGIDHFRRDAAEFVDRLHAFL